MELKEIRAKLGGVDDLLMCLSTDMLYGISNINIDWPKVCDEELGEEKINGIYAALKALDQHIETRDNTEALEALERIGNSPRLCDCTREYYYEIKEDEFETIKQHIEGKDQ